MQRPRSTVVRIFRRSEPTATRRCPAYLQARWCRKQHQRAEGRHERVGASQAVARAPKSTRGPVIAARVCEQDQGPCRAGSPATSGYSPGPIARSISSCWRQASNIQGRQSCTSGSGGVRKKNQVKVRRIHRGSADRARESLSSRPRPRLWQAAGRAHRSLRVQRCTTC